MGLITAPTNPRPTDDGLGFLFRALSPREAGEYFGVPEATIRAEADAGRLPGEKIGDDWRFLGLALARWLFSGTHRIPSVQAAQASKLTREQDAFRELLPTLLDNYREQYVAIHDGRVVASGADKVAVAREAYTKHGYQEILVTRVSAPPPRVIHIGGTPIGTPEAE
jgi:excisionase family DNA binding protein